MGFSTQLRNDLLNTLRATAYSETTIYLSLHQSDPGDTGASEVSGGSYARQAMAMNAPSGGSMTNTADETFTNMPDTTADDISHLGIWDAVSAGTWLGGGALSAAKTTNAGDDFKVAAGNCTISIT